VDRMLDPEPARRPNATDVARTLEGLGALWGLLTEEPRRSGDAR
jgi:hypothetical protein